MFLVRKNNIYYVMISKLVKIIYALSSVRACSYKSMRST